MILSDAFHNTFVIPFAIRLSRLRALTRIRLFPQLCPDDLFPSITPSRNRPPRLLDSRSSFRHYRQYSSTLPRSHSLDPPRYPSRPSSCPFRSSLCFSIPFSPHSQNVAPHFVATVPATRHKHPRTAATRPNCAWPRRRIRPCTRRMGRVQRLYRVVHALQLECGRFAWT